MKVACIIQARTGSTRLPGKVMKKLIGKEVLLHVIDRVLKSKLIDHIVIATTKKEGDDVIVDLVKDYNSKVKVFRGSENDVLDRYYQAAKESEADVVIRVTSDCPLIEGELIDKGVSAFLEGEHDFVSNTMDRTYPRGLDFEIFSFKLLEKVKQISDKDWQKEHVMPYIYENKDKFKIKQIKDNADNSSLRWTLDTEEDFILINNIYEELYKENEFFNSSDIHELYKRKPELRLINDHIEQKKRDE